MKKETKNLLDQGEFIKIIFLLYLNPNRLSLTMAYKIAVEYFMGILRWKKTQIPSLAKVRSFIRSIDPKTIASARSYCSKG